MHKTLRLCLAASLATLLSGCFFGDDHVAEETPPSNTVPASATASSRAYTEFTGSLAPSDSGTPLMVNDVTPPTSESESPLPVT